MTCRIAFVLFPDFQQLDLAGPLAVFEVAERYRPGSYAWRFCATQPGPVRSSAGLHCRDVHPLRQGPDGAGSE